MTDIPGIDGIGGKRPLDGADAGAVAKAMRYAEADDASLQAKWDRAKTVQTELLEV
jgi:hypothetical protein